jgi:hypothetical protein
LAANNSLQSFAGFLILHLRSLIGQLSYDDRPRSCKTAHYTKPAIRPLCNASWAVRYQPP